jgi:hypothetical protein
MQVWNGSNWHKNGSTDVSGSCPLQRNERTFQIQHYANISRLPLPRLKTCELVPLNRSSTCAISRSSKGEDQAGTSQINHFTADPRSK